MKKVLCVPCANGLRAEGKSLKILAAKSVKVTCEVCGRRRFGVAYDVADPAEAKKMG